jgi:hypothetical protein
MTHPNSKAFPAEDLMAAAPVEAHPATAMVILAQCQAMVEAQAPIMLRHHSNIKALEAILTMRKAGVQASARQVNLRCTRLTVKIRRVVIQALILVAFRVWAQLMCLHLKTKV